MSATNDITVTISVTVEDIHRGRPRGCSTCPVAIAIRRVTTERAAVVVKNGYFTLGDGFERLLPYAAYDFIRSFDQIVESAITTRPVSPITFPLSLPREYVKPEFWPAEVRA